MKNYIVKIVLLGLCAILLTSIVIINNFKNDEENSFVENNEKDSSINDTKELPNETIKIEKLFKNIDDYIDQKITVVGYAPWELGNVDNISSANAIYSNDWQNELFVDNVNEAINGGYEVTVTGKIYKEGDKIHIATEKYKINTNIVREEPKSTESNINEKSTFAVMREAAQGYANMNWNQLMKNPTSLAKTVVYIPGKVVDVDVKYGVTSGLIDTQGMGNIDDMVSFEIKGEVYDFNVGDIIVPMGYIDSSTGLATNSMTNTMIETPKIIVENSSLWKNEYPVNLDNQEITEFIYGTYDVINTNDVDRTVGESFEFNKDSINGHKYKYHKKTYDNPRIRIVSGNLMRGYDNIRIGMEIYAEEITGSSNIGAPTTTLSIYLKDNQALLNSSRYYKR